LTNKEVCPLTEVKVSTSSRLSKDVIEMIQNKRQMKMGPPIHERISKDEMIDLCVEAGFVLTETVNVSENLYGLKMEKR